MSDKIRPMVRKLLDDEKLNGVPRKQRLTAARIHRLLEGQELWASEAVVRRVTREQRLELRDPLEHAYLPLAYKAGEDAQVDFFEGEYDDIERGRTKVFILLVRACYSGRTFAYAAPNQTREAFLEGLMQSFAAFGGVFPTIWFDNLTPAVKKVLTGRKRKLQQRFETFQAHYGFKAEFCAPRKGNEKGGVENEVKYARHEVLSPLPKVKGRAEIQALCDAWMERNQKRTARGRKTAIGEMWLEEAPHLIPLPNSRFDAATAHTTKISPRSWVAYGTNHYSAPVEWVGHEVTVKAQAEHLSIHHRSDPPVIHPRCYGKDEMVLELDHYLPLLRRKSRGLDRSAPFRAWIEKAPPCWSAYLSALRARRGEVAGSREFVDTLLLCRTWDEAEVSEAVETSLREIDVSLSTVRYILQSKKEAAEPAVDTIRYDGPDVVSSSPSAYMELCTTGDMSHE